MKLRHHLAVTAVYLAVTAAILSLASLQPRAKEGAQEGAPEGQRAAPAPAVPAKPSFSLSTNRTYGTGDRPRVYINYQGIDQLDFRVYRVKDPVAFFKQLNDPHQIGEAEKSEVAADYRRRPSSLERLRAFKASVNNSVKRYFRGQLRRDSRVAFNDQFRQGDRQPLNVADYARVPLLNPDQVVTTWRERLAPLENEYDTRVVTIGKRDPGVYLVEAVNGDLRAYTIAVVTDLTMVSKTSPGGEMLVYAVDRKAGEPRPDVRVEVVKGRKTLAEGHTGRDGVLKTGISRQPEARPTPRPEDVDPEEARSQVGRDSYLVMASGGGQFAISDLEPYYFGWYGDDEVGNLTGYIYTDRPVYRPGQMVYFKGILRRLGEAGYEAVAGRTVSVTVEDPNNGKLFEKELTLTPRGSFSGEVEIAGGAPLGGYRVVAKVGEAQASSYFEVREYKKPEYKVRVTTPRQFVPVGEKTKFAVEANYFFGAPVANAEVKYYVYRSRYRHWWWRGEEVDVVGGGDAEEEEEEGGYYGYGNDMVKDGEGRLNAQGKFEVEFEVPPPDEKEPWDYSYRLEAQVTDAARRVIEGRASFVGTRGKVVAYARADRYVYYQGDTARIAVKTADYEGRPVAAGVTLKFILRTWDRVEKGGDAKYERFEYKLRERELSAAEVTTNAQGEAGYDYRAAAAGNIYIKTIVREGGKEVVSLGGYLWVADRSNQWGDVAFEDTNSVKLVPDKQTYRPGETAHVLAMLPVDGAHLLVTTELMSVMTVQRLDAAGRAVMIDVPIEERYAPNVYLSVAFVRDGEMYSSDKMLAVPARDKFLSLEIIPGKKEYKPRETASYTVLARHADGSPAPGAEVSVGVVDEAVYSIRPEAAPDIRRAFYGRRYNRVQTNFATSYSFLGYSSDKAVRLAGGRRAAHLADVKNESQYAEPMIRKEFKDTAFWQPGAVTGADGKVALSFTLPDNLTTWRATARAVTAETRIGSSVAKVLARKDLILRLETPRFLTEGDTVTLSGVVHNYLDADKVTKVQLEVSGARLLDPAERTLTVTRQGEQRVDWRVVAPQVGEVKLLAKALTDAESDGVELPLPVVPVGLRQTKGGATTIAEASAEQSFTFDLPANASAQARSLRIEAAPSIAGTLFGALDYLTSFPYGCTEQTMSSFLPNVIVAQTLKEVKTASLRASNDLGKKVQRGLDRLYGYQHGDGGWGWWKDDQTDPFMTAYVIDGLALARAAGFPVESWRLEQGRKKLKALIDAGKTEKGRPVNPEDRAYMVYALGESGEADARYVGDLYARRGELQPYGRALLALALKRRGDEARAREVAGELERAAKANEFDAHWESQRRPMLDFTEVNDTEATALALKALARIAPQSPLLPKAARWLVANRAQGYCWQTTKQTAFAIFGLTDYLKVSRELSPDYTLEVYLNGEPAVTRRVTAADVAGAQTFVVERRGGELPAANQVRVVKRGGGVLYLSSTLDYFTQEEDVAPRSSGNLKLTREYLRLRVTEKEGQAKWAIEPLSGELRSGDLLVSRLRVQGARARYLMIEDPIPAGCEQVEQVSGIDLSYREGRWSDWYSSREFRDQKTALFVDDFDGDATFQYALRVEVPGDFRAAPARAELMYQPTVQSNTGNAKVNILDKK